MLERYALWPGDVHSANGWKEVLVPVIRRYTKRDIKRFLRSDVNVAIPAFDKQLEKADYFYALQLPANSVVREKITHWHTRPVECPSGTKQKRSYEDLRRQVRSGKKARRVIIRTGRSAVRAVPRDDSIVTNLPMKPGQLVRFIELPGAAEQHVKEDNYAFGWTWPLCKPFCDNEVGLQLHSLA